MKALVWSNPEGVHDMRVFSRRLRSAIADFEPHLRKPALPIAKLKTIAKNLGAVRDEDVAIAALEELKTAAHGDVPEGIEVFIDERKKVREAARAALTRAIRRAVIDDFYEQFEKAITRISIGSKKLAARSGSAPVFGTIAAKVIAARLKAF